MTLKRSRSSITLSMVAIGLLTGSLVAPGRARADESTDLQDRLVQLKASTKKDQATLRTYQWIETVVVTMNGEEKARKQNRCYYGADGTLQKVAVGDQPTEAQKRGLRGKVIAEKKGELTDYMNKAVTTIKKYVPPDPARLQAVKDAGKMSVTLTDPGKSARFDFHDYLVAGDVLGIQLDLTHNTIQSINVTTILEGDKDPTTFIATFKSLQDGTGYPAATTLDAKSQGITINITNSGYLKSTGQ